MASVRGVSSPAFPPRKFPSTGFEVIDPDKKVEEERLPFYEMEDFYPMHIGEVVGGHYQVVGKLGYGTSSTVWLARDLRDQKFWALKVHINTLKHNHELEVYRYLDSTPAKEYIINQQHVRRLETSFQLHGPHGSHLVFVMAPMTMSLQIFLGLRRGKPFEPLYVQQVVNQVLVGLCYLHAVDVIHADLHPGNLLIGITDDSIPSVVEERELHKPSERKRAWDLLEKEPLVGLYDEASPEQNDAHHLAALTALLGPPPSEFLQRSEKTAKFWDADSKKWPYRKWKGPVPVPSDKTLESLSSSLSGEEKSLFLDFIRCLLRWVPEERPDCTDAYFHPWLGNKHPDLEPEEDDP
ncbi:hypothetical protein EKO27_g4271 [Xylaria grammica]|uniref:Protein kinase domain-containing protein n=1 Tax=Xylaria grammica TaxID=363999 RepID=A0A439D8W8_9PEZI|nr:hypothetical protein EKO27_g4271 [Xylaria grammica]